MHEIEIVKPIPVIKVYNMLLHLIMLAKMADIFAYQKFGSLSLYHPAQASCQDQVNMIQCSTIQLMSLTEIRSTINYRSYQLELQR